MVMQAIVRVQNKKLINLMHLNADTIITNRTTLFFNHTTLFFNHTTLFFNCHWQSKGNIVVVVCILERV